MPGLIMNNNGADGATGSRDGENRKRTHDGKLLNGERIAKKDGAFPASTAHEAVGAPSVNGIPASTLGPGTGASDPLASQVDALSQLPPELAVVTSDAYHSFPKLIQRLTQECFNHLAGTLQTLAEMPVNPQTNGVLTNGVNGYAMANGGADNSEVNRSKKLAMMRFAQDSRAKFIKMLVLTEWGKKYAFDIKKLIDINAWAREQLFHLDGLDEQMFHLKMDSNSYRDSNPDVRTALEVLSTGKASWIPDLGFIPPEPMSSQKALKLLRYLDTALAVRLTVYEELPRHLKNWRVGSGRATFTVDSEFELDVLAFGEDVSEQWHFIDLRLLFSPAPSVAVGTRFYNYFKPHLDRILMQSGLSGCFDFLHGFILTHKISILKAQAYELLRNGWAGTLKVEPVHRSLIVQYWTDRPGKKSWLEIGIASRKPKNGKVSWRGPPVPELAVRWFSQGVEIKNADFKFDWKHLSLERMLKRIIASHITTSLETARKAIPKAIITKEKLSQTEPCECSLEAYLGIAENKTSVFVDPVTGRIALRPCTLLSARAEHTLNQSRDPWTSIGNAVTHVLSSTLQDHIQKHAQQLGWRQPARLSLKLDTVRQKTKLDVLQFSLFWARGWPPNWALASVIDSAGEGWWIFELGSRGATIEYAEQLRTDDQSQKLPISRETLASVERIAVQLTSFRVSIKELQARKIPVGFQPEISLPSRPSQEGWPQTAARGWVLQLRTADVLGTKPEDHAWLRPGLQVTCHGFTTNHRNVWHIVSGSMVKSVAAEMRKIMSASPQSNFTFSENGNFAILLVTPFGEPIVDDMRARLKDIDRLRSFTTTLQKRRMMLRSSSLGQVEFQYGEKCKATVNFSQEKDIKVSFNTNNPHHRIHTLLTEIINERSQGPQSVNAEDDTSLDRFCTTLMITRPILRALSEIESETPGNLSNPAIHTHDYDRYRITYANPLCSFDLRIHPKGNKVYWQIEDNDKKSLEARPGPERSPNHKRRETLKEALKALFKAQGNGWFGVRGGILCTINGVPDALKCLHKAVLSCKVEGETQPPAPSTDVKPVVKAPTANMMPTNARPNGMQKANVRRPGVGPKAEIIELD